MPRVDDEESLSDVNKQFKPEMEEDKLEILGIECAEECESTSGLSKPSVSVGGDRDVTVSLEGNPVSDNGGEGGVLQNHVAGRELELFVECAVDMVDKSVIEAEDAVAEEGGGGIITSPIGDSSLVMAADEGAKQDIGADGVAIVTDTGGVPVFAELQVDNKGEELLVDPKHKMDAECKSQMDVRRDERPLNPQLEMTIHKEFNPDVDPKMEVVDPDVGYKQQLPELQGEVSGCELNTMEGMETMEDKPHRELGYEQNVEAVGGVDTESLETLALGNNEKAVECDQFNEETVDFLVNDSEIGITEKQPGLENNEKHKVGPGILEEMPNNKVKMDGGMITEVIALVGNVSGQEQVPASSDGMQHLGGDEKSEFAEEKEVAADQSLMSGTKMVNNENLSMDVLTKLDEPLNVSDYKEDVLVKDELPAADTNPEIPAGMGLELKSNAVVDEIQSMDDEVETELGTNSYPDKTPDGDGKLKTEDTMSDVDDPGQNMYDSPAGVQEEEDEALAAEEETGTQDTEMETETDVVESGKTSTVKRKRGKLSKSPSISKPAAKASSRKIVGDDVCFICFDGGELVLCDRRGCPKAYHPSCVNRDEAFFKSKGRWNCGWHLCSNCEKNARYMCYTCTFSLCKGCTKDSIIFCIRGNKGFCETCMRTVTLIENNEQGNKDTQIDFDDRSSWEFLFKDYYLELKVKLSLSSDEIKEARNLWKGADMPGPSKQESTEAQPDADDGGSGSDNSIENSATIRPKRRKIKKQSKSRSKTEELVSTGVVSSDKAVSLSDNSEWASKELLEFVSHMKDGDMSMLSQFDVQALLLEYIKRNKLRDPRRKSQIICDARLENLFGKPRVGHFEMLKLLESHFLLRNEQNDDFQGSVVDTENNQLDGDVTAESLTKGVKDRKRKSRRKGDSRGPQSNLDDYAAIDMHNIGLIYLRRKLMEDLLEDAETFHDKVIGTFVRIRISGTNQKQDLYRLVQVVGTNKAPEPYKVGKRTTDIMVEILNLDKTENISIDTISNQEFTEEECKRLRQSIKCGLISRLNVGEILDKTMEIQVARVNDWLETETLRLSHLRDRASDLGRRKELRECVEGLQLLNTPEERLRRLEEIPEIHADPKMDPSYESDENDSENEDARRDAFMRSKGSGFGRRGRGPISPVSDNSLKDSWSGAGKATPSRNLSGSNFTTISNHIGELVNENSWSLESHRDRQESNISDKQNLATNSESTDWAQRNVSRPESLSGVASVPSQGSNSTGAVELKVKVNESEKMWHYQDPSGKVQGPFSMVQLRKWNNTGYFPAVLRIWRTTEKQENSILLTDVLAGKFPKELPDAEHALPSSHTLAGHSAKVSTTPLRQEKERVYINKNSGSHSKSSGDNWAGNDTTSLPSPTPRQSNSGLLTGAVESPAVNGVLPSPTAVLPSMGPHSSTPASVLSSIVQTATFNPIPNSQQGILVGSTVSLHTQSTTVSEPHIAQVPVQTVANQSLHADSHVWGSSSIAQSGQPHGYSWTAPNVQSSSGSFSNSVPAAVVQSDIWMPAQSSQPNMQPPAAPNPNASWGMGPAENNTSMGLRPQNPNVGWGTMPANPNMGWGNPPPGNTNVNWCPPMQTASGWGPPPTNTGASIQGMVPGNPNPGWVATQGWGSPPVQGPAAGNIWGPPSGNSGAPPAVQGPRPGPGQVSTNQAWAPWGGEQNQSGGQFSGQRGSQGCDSGFNGGRPWNRQSSFSGGGPRQSKRDTLCPYNANGRCKKGAHCNYLHS